MKPYPIRIRDDKTEVYKTTKSIFGNNFNTALSNYENCLDPITKEYLEKPVDDSYFNLEDKTTKYEFFKLFGRTVRVFGFKKNLEFLK